MKKRTRILTACIAVIIIFCTLVPVAYAVEEGPLITFEPPFIPEPGKTPVPSAPIVTPDPPATSTPVETQKPSATSAPTETPKPSVSTEPTATPEASGPDDLLPPPGTGTVIDSENDGAGKVFYTIMTPDEHVFYLVIDNGRNADNVYFLNAVTMDDLLPLASLPVDSGSKGNTVPASPVITEPTPGPTSEQPAPEPEPQKSGGNGMMIVVVLVILAGAGAGYYFKVYRPKQRGAVNPEAEDYVTEDRAGLDDWDEQELDGQDWDAGDDEQ